MQIFTLAKDRAKNSLILSPLFLMKNLRLYASFAAGTALSATVIAALLISATPVNTQASTQGIPISSGGFDAEILAQMEAIAASAEQATTAAVAAGVDIPDWILPLSLFVSTIPQGLSTRYGPVVTDINGDGLPDFIYSMTGTAGDWGQYVLLNTGNGWEEATSCYYDGDVWSGDCEFRNL